MGAIPSLFPLLFCAGSLAAQSLTVTDTVDRFVRAELARQRIPGISVAVLRGDSMLLARGYGSADVELRVPAIGRCTPLGCDDVRDRGVSRLRSRIEHICYAKGTAKQGSLLFTVLYGGNWRAAGLDNVFGI